MCVNIFKKSQKQSQVWHTTIISALGRLRQGSTHINTQSQTQIDIVSLSLSLSLSHTNISTQTCMHTRRC